MNCQLGGGDAMPPEDARLYLRLRSLQSTFEDDALLLAAVVALRALDDAQARRDAPQTLIVEWRVTVVSALRRFLAEHPQVELPPEELDRFLGPGEGP